MDITTKFDIGDKVKRHGYPEIAEVTGINVEIQGNRTVEPTVTYDLYFSKYEAANGGANFGGSAYEPELEAA